MFTFDKDHVSEVYKQIRHRRDRRDVVDPRQLSHRTAFGRHPGLRIAGYVCVGSKRKYRAGVDLVAMTSAILDKAANDEARHFLRSW